jgi:hypothetical protein
MIDDSTTRRSLLKRLGITGAAGLAGVGLSGSASASDGYEITIDSGTSFDYVETDLGEAFITADLADGSTYYFFQEENDLFGNDEVVLVLAETGEVLYLQSLDGVLYTESEIGEMADRIGEMADRIVYTEELVVETEYLIVDVIFYTQDSVLEFVDMLNPLDLV